MVMMAAGVTLVNAGFEWITEWFAWLFVVGFGAVGYFTVTSGTCAAGAEWFFHNRRWVRQYELSSVRVRMRFSKRYLHLLDRDSRKLVIFIDDVQENQRLWDLVYNGIRALRRQRRRNQLGRPPRPRTPRPGAVTTPDRHAEAHQTHGTSSLVR